MVDPEPYELRILSSVVGGRPADLRASVEAALSQGDPWVQFVEVRMGAGPTVRIDRTAEPSGSALVDVEWADQHASMPAVDVLAAIEVADRVAHVFFEVRREGLATPRGGG